MTTTESPAMPAHFEAWPINEDCQSGALEPKGTYSTEFVVKIERNCNLACNGCYVYESADTSWLQQPNRMSPDTMDAVAGRITEHALDHDLQGVRVVFHGGEPLLPGADYLNDAFRRFREPIESKDIMTSLAIQTNGTRLVKPETLDALARHMVSVGVSINGDRAANDKSRNYRNGRSSYDDALAGVMALKDRAPHLYSGVLCVIDIENDPLTTYRSIRDDFDPPMVDFLFPHHNWVSRPRRHTSESDDTSYADWLLAIDTARQQDIAAGRKIPKVRILEAIRNPQGDILAETVGLRTGNTVVVAVNGELQPVDTLSTTYDGALRTGYWARRNTIDDLLKHPLVAQRGLGRAGLSQTCKQCPIVEACGGGNFTHRYSAENNFDNPTVYCEDNRKLIETVRGTRR